MGVFSLAWGRACQSYYTERECCRDISTSWVYASWEDMDPFVVVHLLIRRHSLKCDTLGWDMFLGKTWRMRAYWKGATMQVEVSSHASVAFNEISSGGVSECQGSNYLKGGVLLSSSLFSIALAHYDVTTFKMATKMENKSATLHSSKTQVWRVFVWLEIMIKAENSKLHYAQGTIFSLFSP